MPADGAAKMSPAQVGQSVPEFRLECVDSQFEQPVRRTLSDYAGQWLILVFYPRDFSFVCPTELTAFSARLEEFTQRGCQLLGVSVDTLALHREWLTTPPAQGGLGPLRYPLASDPAGELARQFGVWDSEHEVALRGLFIIDPEGLLQYSVVQNLSVGRNAGETLRVLDALQAGGLCPAGWTSADGQLDPESLLRPGTVLGHYRLRDRLGSGSFGNVFDAWDLRLERPVALKILHRSGSHARVTALQEARAAARISHPNLCTVYAVDEEEGLPLIVMERLTGVTLAERLSQGELTDSSRSSWMKGVVAGLLAAHREQIPHGDLKPANIMITDAGQPVILDFGLAGDAVLSLPESNGHISGETESFSRTTVILPVSTTAAPFTISGTPAYMSPEQAQGGGASLASDVFSLGLIFYEMLTGERALSDSTPLAIVLRLQQDEIGAGLSERLSAPWREVIASMLQRDPVHRPSLLDIESWLAQIVG